MERLHRHNIYPIVLLLKFRHHKQIREVCESHHPPAERISQKEAKEMFELAAKMEQEYKHVISGECHAIVASLFSQTLNSFIINHLRAFRFLCIICCKYVSCL